MKYCKKCKKEYPEKRNFCEDCGGKLVKFVEHEEKVKPEKKKVETAKTAKPSFKPKKLIIVAVAVIIAVFFIYYASFAPSGYLGPSKSSDLSVNQPQETNQPSTSQSNCREVQETYTEQVPYTVQVPYEEQESYTTYLSAQIISATHNEKWNLNIGYYEEAVVKLKNIDNEAGWFTVTINWKTLYRNSTGTVRHYVEPDKTVDFVSTFDKNMGEDITYTYTYTSDPVTRTRMVTKYRTETQYREETKYRTVTKCD